MKKTILSIALVIAGLMGSSAIAQTPATTTQQTAQAAQGRKMPKTPNPFEGINLSEKQQGELKALNEGLKAERKKIEAQEQAEKKDMREQRMKDKKEYLAKIKEILEPEQYVKFLENSYLNNANGHMGQRNAQMGPRNAKDQKHGKSDRKGDRKGGHGDRSASVPAAQIAQ